MLFQDMDVKNGRVVVKDGKDKEEKRETIYFTIERKPYTYPIQMKRPNSTKEEVLKEFPDAKILNKDTKDIGKHNDRPDSDFDADELELGIKIEMEHTDNKEEAKDIAKDHLSEIKDYYTRLKKMEAEAKTKDDGEVNVSGIRG